MCPYLPTRPSTLEQWDSKRLLIEKLYWEEDRSLPELILVMKNEHGFSATTKQYKKQFDRWNLKKNISTREMRSMLRIRRRRKEQQDKNTRFTLRKRPVAEHKMQRFQNRKCGSSVAAESSGPERGRTPSELAYSTPSPPKPRSIDHSSCASQPENQHHREPIPPKVSSQRLGSTQQAEHINGGSMSDPPSPDLAGQWMTAEGDAGCDPATALLNRDMALGTDLDLNRWLLDLPHFSADLSPANEEPPGLPSTSFEDMWIDVLAAEDSAGSQIPPYMDFEPAEHPTCANNPSNSLHLVSSGVIDAHFHDQGLAGTLWDGCRAFSENQNRKDEADGKSYSPAGEQALQSSRPDQPQIEEKLAAVTNTQAPEASQDDQRRFTAKDKHHSDKHLRNSNSKSKSSDLDKAIQDDWCEVTDKEERRRIQNRIAQRKFREKVREEKQKAASDIKIREHAGSSYQIPTPKDIAVDDEELSGLPWGGPNLRYIVAKGHASASGSFRGSTSSAGSDYPRLQSLFSTGGGWSSSYDAGYSSDGEDRFYYDYRAGAE